MELIDLYDGSRVRTGRTAERGSAVRPGEYCLVSHLCLFNGRGELLVQRRSVYKDRYPGCWDVSAGGFVRSGEDASDAALREAREELGLSLAKAELRFVLTEPFSCVFDDFFLCAGSWMSPGWSCRGASCPLQRLRPKGMCSICCAAGSLSITAPNCCAVSSRSNVRTGQNKISGDRPNTPVPGNLRR